MPCVPQRRSRSPQAGPARVIIALSMIISNQQPKTYGKEANESIDILPAERRLARRDRGGHGCDAAGALPAYVERVDRTRQTCRRPRLRFGELYRAPLPHRGLRAFQQPRAARPLLRDADEAHPRLSALYRAAG